MPLILSRNNKQGTRDIMIILGEDNIERMKEKDPFELRCWELPWTEPLGVVTISYANPTEMVQIEQLARQGKQDEAMKIATGTTSGFAYRPDKGDHDRGPERLG
jgi:hypothetical protein